jgi:hypothetical protein
MIDTKKSLRGLDEIESAASDLVHVGVPAGYVTMTPVSVAVGLSLARGTCPWCVSEATAHRVSSNSKGAHDARLYRQLRVWQRLGACRYRQLRNV